MFQSWRQCARVEDPVAGPQGPGLDGLRAFGYVGPGVTEHHVGVASRAVRSLKVDRVSRYNFLCTLPHETQPSPQGSDLTSISLGLLLEPLRAGQPPLPLDGTVAGPFHPGVLQGACMSMRSSEYLSWSVCVCVCVCVCWASLAWVFQYPQASALCLCFSGMFLRIEVITSDTFFRIPVGPGRGNLTLGSSRVTRSGPFLLSPTHLWTAGKFS